MVLDVRPTRDVEDHIARAQRAYVDGEIEAGELEHRIELALEGFAVVDPDVPMFDKPQKPPLWNLGPRE